MKISTIKQVLPLIAFIALLLLPITASAIRSFEPGGEYNPIHVEIREDPLQRSLRRSRNSYDALNQTMRRSVQYVDACADKYRAIEAYKDRISDGGMDLGNPGKSESANSHLNFLFDSYEMCARNAQRTSCPQGTVVKDGACVTPDVGCKKTYGQHSKFEEYDSETGYPVCGCASGYAWNNAGTACVLNSQESTNTVNFGPRICASMSTSEKEYRWDDERKKCEEVIEPVTPARPDNTPPPKTNNALCRDEYGVNSVWTGELNDTGGPYCGCRDGYQFEGDTCVPVPSPKTNNQMCRESYGTHSVWSGALNDKGEPVCDCASGYQWKWDVKDSSCIKTPADKSEENTKNGSGAPDESVEEFLEVVNNTNSENQTAAVSASNKEQGKQSGRGFVASFFSFLLGLMPK